MRREIIDYAKRSGEEDPRLKETVRKAILTLQLT
jgi:hypothetical protein